MEKPAVKETSRRGQQSKAAKKSADLLVWAAQNAAAQGMPQATNLQANADAALAKTKAMSEALA